MVFKIIWNIIFGTLVIGFFVFIYRGIANNAGISADFSKSDSIEANEILVKSTKPTYIISEALKPNYTKNINIQAQHIMPSKDAEIFKINNNSNDKFEVNLKPSAEVELVTPKIFTIYESGEVTTSNPITNTNIITSTSTSPSTTSASSTFVTNIPTYIARYNTTSDIQSADKTFIERLEEVATDGEGALLPLNNEWGEHQSRITSHKNGEIRALYYYRNVSNMVSWRVMKRDLSGVWTIESTGVSTDDVNVLRDNSSDLAFVIDWGDSVPRISTSPLYTPKTISNEYEYLSPSSRHYSSAGISDNGVVCLSAVKERLSGSLIYTKDMVLQLICGQDGRRDNTWSWRSLINVDIGERAAYNYMYIRDKAEGSSVSLLGQLDLHKSATAYNNIASGEGNYIFNGVREYELDLEQQDISRINNVIDPMVRDNNSTLAPQARQIDSYADKNENIYTSYYVKNTTIDNPGRTTDGFYYEVTDKNNNRVASGKYNLPAYGKIRVFEDVRGRKWLLWANLGSQMTQLDIYKLSLSGGSITLSGRVDLSDKVKDYALLGSPMLASPRGGQYIGNALDMILYVCENKFINYSLASCYNGEKNKERVIYVRIRLED